MADTAIVTNINPMLLMVPAVLRASCAFMLPVGTAPNAIVYGSELITVKQKARAGLVMNMIGVAIISMVCLVVL